MALKQDSSVTKQQFCDTVPRMNVLFVCQGNICRSPLAHTVAEALVEKKNLKDSITVDSAGVSAYHVGQGADRRMREVAATYGYTIATRSRQFVRSDFERFDLILAMDQENFRELQRLAKSGDHRGKIRLFRDFDPAGRGSVPDPYYGGNRGFHDVYTMVSRTCAVLVDELITSRD